FHSWVDDAAKLRSGAPPVKSGKQDIEHRGGVAQVAEDDVRAGRPQCLLVVPPGRDRHGRDAQRATAGDIVRGIPDDHNVPAAERYPGQLGRALHRDRRQPVPLLAVASVRTEAEHAGIDPRGRQLDRRAMHDVARQQREHGILLLCQLAEQLTHARQHDRLVAGRLQLTHQLAQVRVPEARQLRVDRGIRQTCQAEQLARDLRIRLPAEMMRGDRSGRTVHLEERTVERAPGRTTRGQDRTVDIEQDELAHTMIRRLLLALPLAAIGAFWFWFLTTPWPVTLRFRDPSTTAFMRMRVEQAAAAGEELEIDYRPVPLEQIAPAMRRAAVVAVY